VEWPAQLADTGFELPGSDLASGYGWTCSDQLIGNAGGPMPTLPVPERLTHTLDAELVVRVTHAVR
jgi:hypothetical protein